MKKNKRGSDMYGILSIIGAVLFCSVVHYIVIPFLDKKIEDNRGDKHSKNYQ